MCLTYILVVVMLQVFSEFGAIVEAVVLEEKATGSSKGMTHSLKYEHIKHRELYSV